MVGFEHPGENKPFTRHPDGLAVFTLAIKFGDSGDPGSQPVSRECLTESQYWS